MLLFAICSRQFVVDLNKVTFNIRLWKSRGLLEPV